MNLALNGADAMPDGGALVFSTSMTVADITLGLDRRPGPYVRLIVRDTGVGMDPGTLDRIFEPFFTTKQAGRGSGLGLSTAHGIVKQCGGEITVVSSPGKGSTFRIDLPVDVPVPQVVNG